MISAYFLHKFLLYNFMQFHTTPRRNGVKMVYGKSDCRRENDTLLPPPQNRMKALMEHTAIGMTVQRICRWLFHFLLHFGANMEKNIASTSLGFPSYLATPPCDNGISCANKGWNLTFAGLCLNSKALSEIICRILYFISYNLYFAISPLSFNRKCDILWSATEGG